MYMNVKIKIIFFLCRNMYWYMNVKIKINYFYTIVFQGPIALTTT